MARKFTGHVPDPTKREGAGCLLGIPRETSTSSTVPFPHRAGVLNLKQLHALVLYFDWNSQWRPRRISLLPISSPLLANYKTIKIMFSAVLGCQSGLQPRGLQQGGLYIDFEQSCLRLGIGRGHRLKFGSRGRALKEFSTIDSQIYEVESNEEY